MKEVICPEILDIYVDRMKEKLGDKSPCFHFRSSTFSEFQKLEHMYHKGLASFKYQVDACNQIIDDIEPMFSHAVIEGKTVKDLKGAFDKAGLRAQDIVTVHSNLYMSELLGATEKKSLEFLCSTLGNLFAADATQENAKSDTEETPKEDQEQS